MVYGAYEGRRGWEDEGPEDKSGLEATDGELGYGVRGVYGVTGLGMLHEEIGEWANSGAIGSLGLVMMRISPKDAEPGVIGGIGEVGDSKTGRHADQPRDGDLLSRVMRTH